MNITKLDLEHDEPPRNLVAVLVDGKPVKNILKLDTKEGWVEVALPKSIRSQRVDRADKTLLNLANEPDSNDPDDLIYETKKLTGKVELIWR